MENFEKDELWQEEPRLENPVQEQPLQETPAAQQPYHGAGTGRKESPFANSPYMMNHPQPEPTDYRQQYTYTPPVLPQKPKKEKKSGRKVW